MIYLLIIIGVLLIIMIVSGWYVASSIFHPKTWDYKKTYEHEFDKGLIDLDYLSRFSIQDVYIEHDQNRLHAHLINNKSDKSIILMHGHTFSLYGGYKYIKIFLDLGFNVLLPDQRFHGLSEGKSCTLGLKESTDLDAWTKYLIKEIPESKVLGYHGESMGAATVMLNGHNEHVSFVISDCGFASLKKQTKELLWKNHKLPPFLVYPASLMGRILYGAQLLKVNPQDNIPNIEAPILFIHGDDDQYIGYDHVEILSSLAKNSTVLSVKGADHAKSVETDYQLYYDTVHKFLRKEGIINEK